MTRLNSALPFGLATATYEELAHEFRRRTDWGAETRAAYIGDVRAFFRWACDPLDPRVDFDPSVYLKRPKVKRGMPRPCTDEELATIVENAGQPYRLWSLLAAYGGLRCVEISGLDRQDVTRQRIIVFGKGAKPGAIPTHPLIWEAIEPLPVGPIAVLAAGRRLTPKAISSRTGLYFRTELGLTGVTLHRLRHWFGTNVQETYGDLRVTQELLRHASPATTAIYTQVADARKSAAVASLPRVA